MKGMLALLIGLCGVAHASEPPVQVCLGESNEWPPFTYWERHDGQPDPSRLTGSATTLVLGALNELGLEYRIHYLPWARVQQELAEYAEKRRCELTWDASFKPERAEYAYYSVPLYRTQLGLFYSQRRFAEPPRLELPGPLRGYRVCGVIGYNYAPYGIGDQIQQMPGIQQSLDMLERGRCDFFPSEIEPLLGGIALGIYQGHPQLRSLKLMPSKQFYVLVSKASPRAKGLINDLNQRLIAFEESGHSATVFRRFLAPSAECAQSAAGCQSQ